MLMREHEPPAHTAPRAEVFPCVPAEDVRSRAPRHTHADALTCREAATRPGRSKRKTRHPSRNGDSARTHAG
eukprot:7089029-Pyramimonas_sp.AAC.1